MQGFRVEGAVTGRFPHQAVTRAELVQAFEALVDLVSPCVAEGDCNVNPIVITEARDLITRARLVPSNGCSYEEIPDATTSSGVHYRVHDAADNRVATCYLRENAERVVKALNGGTT